MSGVSQAREQLIKKTLFWKTIITLNLQTIKVCLSSCLRLLSIVSNNDIPAALQQASRSRVTIDQRINLPPLSEPHLYQRLLNFAYFLSAASGKSYILYGESFMAYANLRLLKHLSFAPLQEVFIRC